MKKRYNPHNPDPAFKRCPACGENKPRGEVKWVYCSPCRGEQQRQARAAKQARGVTQAEIDRFWNFVQRGDGDACDVWTGKKGAYGYGQFEAAGQNGNAHLALYRILGIPIPAGKVIDHKCRNRACVKLEHTRIVTPRVNATENNVSPIAKNAQKTHCIRGHEFTPENTWLRTIRTRKNRHGTPIEGGGIGRECIACYRLRRPNTRRFIAAEHPFCDVVTI